MSVRALMIACAFLAASAAITRADELAKLPSTNILPKGTVKVSGVVPRMGEHWANPKDLPLGPIYCVLKGKVICIEYMISQADLQAGKSWPELTGLTNLPSINHVSMGFEPNGHEGFTVPHYDMHIYFVSPKVLDTIKPEKTAKAH